MAHALGRSLSIAWATERTMPARAEDVFAKEYIEDNFLAYPELDNYKNILISRPPLVTEKYDSFLISGTRYGEQRFINKFDYKFRTLDPTIDIVLNIGGKFKLGRNLFFRDDEYFRDERSRFYSKIKLSDNITNRIAENLAIFDRKTISLHVRGTDRSAESINDHKILKAITKDSMNDDWKRIFISGDEAQRVGALKKKLIDRGFDAFTLENTCRDRSAVRGVLDAVVDWNLLSKSRKIIFFEGTTFSYEAAVAGGIFSKSIMLRQNIYRRVKRISLNELANYRLYGEPVFNEK